jgi:hypothetical protein
MRERERERERSLDSVNKERKSALIPIPTTKIIDQH